jgi:hypothetical protein
MDVAGTEAYTGNGSTQTISGLELLAGFGVEWQHADDLGPGVPPDFVWIKEQFASL